MGLLTVILLTVILLTVILLTVILLRKENLRDGIRWSQS
jgi:hypothetical protein